MRIRILSSADRTARAAAAHIAAHVRSRPRMVLGLPTGRTVFEVYAELVRACAAGRVSFADVQTVNLDEFVGLGHGDAGSFCTFMDGHFFRHVNVARGHRHLLDGRATDATAECRRYERMIAKLGGIDVQLLGVGENGHIGFNEPGSRLVARTHHTRLTLTTRRANAGRFDNRVAAVPRFALTMGMGTILEARSIVLIATGRSKRRAVRALLSGTLSCDWPVSFLQAHRDVTVFVDRDAAGGAGARSVR